MHLFCTPSILKCLAFLSLFNVALAASATDWLSRSIYQVLTDRFALTDDAGTPCDTAPQLYCNGTFKGIVNHLDYIQAMGFDAIWISPVVTNLEGNSAGEGDAYHGYWTQDITTINKHFGTSDDLKALSKALHSRGMYLMLDVVINHFASFGLPNDTTISAYGTFNAPDLFHPQCFISDYNNQTNVEQCWLGDTTVALADLNTESQTVIDGWNKWITGMVSEYSLDGLRIDTLKHVRKPFWPAFQQAAGVYAVGEVLINDTSYASDYSNFIDGVLDYPGYYALTQAFSSTSGNMSLLLETSHQTQSLYKNGAFSTAAFLENHDQPRFQSTVHDQSLVKNAMTWSFVTDAIPILYQGQEQGYGGGNVPANREALWLSAYVTSNTLHGHVTSLNSARKAAIAANSSYTSVPMVVSSPSESTILVSKLPMLAFMSNVGAFGSYNAVGGGYQPNEALVETLSCKTLNADGNGNINFASTDGLPMVCEFL
ncbi:alpha-amylase [Sistotremastrum suecicum HHB10207 ss-3]|uniref:alpha-amylase n=1 Tax=Sistotremastrum suecicum HHB10207 ss-3 TaxID=1314776 RepID=A0A166G9R8_9AGAM|nr:alpha-amylase [Sistotremastrum suecicum HHB10207 ss-3]